MRSHLTFRHGCHQSIFYFSIIINVVGTLHYLGGNVKGSEMNLDEKMSYDCV